MTDKLSNKNSKETDKIADEKHPMFLFAFILFLMLLGFVFTSLLMIILIGLAPSFVAMITDREGDKSLSFCVLLCNLCGVIPYIVENVNAGITLASGVSIIQNPINIIIMMLSAGLGWTLYYCVPYITVILAKNRDESKLYYWRKRYFELREDWGNAIPESEIIQNCTSLEPSESPLKKEASKTAHSSF